MSAVLSEKPAISTKRKKSRGDLAAVPKPTHPATTSRKQPELTVLPEKRKRKPRKRATTIEDEPVEPDVAVEAETGAGAEALEPRRERKKAHSAAEAGADHAEPAPAEPVAQPTKMFEKPRKRRKSQTAKPEDSTVAEPVVPSSFVVPDQPHKSIKSTSAVVEGEIAEKKRKPRTREKAQPIAAPVLTAELPATEVLATVPPAEDQPADAARPKKRKKEKTLIIVPEPTPVVAAARPAEEQQAEEERPKKRKKGKESVADALSQESITPEEPAEKRKARSLKKVALESMPTPAAQMVAAASLDVPEKVPGARSKRRRAVETNIRTADDGQVDGEVEEGGPGESKPKKKRAKAVEAAEELQAVEEQKKQGRSAKSQDADPPAKSTKPLKAPAIEEPTQHTNVAPNLKPKVEKTGKTKAPSPSPELSEPDEELEMHAPTSPPHHSDQDDADDSDAGDEDVHLHGFSTDDDDSSDDDMVEEWAGLDIDKLPTIAKDDVTVKRKLEKAKRQPTEDRGVIYLGRIPHGFYEDQMKAYFSQFGTVTRLRLSRNKRTGRSKHYGFIEFDSSSVAQIVAETMDNYLLTGHILTCKVVQKDMVHPELWVGANRKWRVVPRDRVARVLHNKPRTEEEQVTAEARLLKRQALRKRKLEEAGIKYDFEAVAYKKKSRPTEA